MRLRRRGPAPQTDRGASLVELVVAMGIFTVVIATFMAGVVIMSRNAVAAQAVSDAGDRLRVTFQRLDKEVRYADAINLPGAGASGARYVEFRTPATVSASGVATCTQWRFDPSTGTLASRSWAASASPPATFTTVSSNLTTPASATSTYPFVVDPATSTRPHQRLTISLQAQPVNSGTFVSESSSFVARNSSVNSPGNADVDSNGVSDSPACWTVGVRP